MATAEPTIEFGGKCVFCLDDLVTRPKVRKLNCEHLACNECLVSEKDMKKGVKCPECKSITEKSLDSLEVVSTYQVYNCQSKNCEAEAATYCSTCSKLFCKQHDQSHSDLHDEHKDNVIGVDLYCQQSKTLELEQSKICPNHVKDYIAVCQMCLELLCEGCLDKPSDDVDDCDHQSRPVSIQKGSELAYDTLVYGTHRLQDVDRKLESLLKFANQQVDVVTEGNKLLIKNLYDALKKWKDKLDEATARFEDLINESTHQFETETRLFEREINERLKSNQTLEDRTCEFSEQEPLVILQGCKEQEQDLNLCRIEAIPQLPVPTLYQLTNLTAEIPWKVKRLRSPFYQSLTVVDQIKTPSKCFTVAHLSDGTLVHGGKYGSQGLESNMTQISLTSLFPRGSGNNEETFTFGLRAGKWEITTVDTFGCFRHIATYDSGGRHPSYSHITANQKYIITCDAPTEGLKVFSTTDFKHQFDIKHQLINDYPWGIEILLDNTVVVSDGHRNTVANMTIEEKPQIIWQVEVKKPSGIHLDKATNCILVVCMDDIESKICVISIDGRLLTTLQVPGVDSFAFDLSVHQDQLAIANDSRGVKLFNINYLVEDVDN